MLFINQKTHTQNTKTGGGWVFCRRCCGQRNSFSSHVSYFQQHEVHHQINLSLLLLLLLLPTKTRDLAKMVNHHRSHADTPLVYSSVGAHALCQAHPMVTVAEMPRGRAKHSFSTTNTDGRVEECVLQRLTHLFIYLQEHT